MNTRVRRVVARGVAWSLVLLALCLPGESVRAGEIFPAGEVLTYQLHWGPLPVGIATLSTDWAIVEGRSYGVIRFKVRTNKALGAIYPVHDELVCYLDPDTLLPTHLIKKTNEGNVHSDDELFFDHKNRRARWISHTQNKTVEYEIGTNTHGLVSFLYWMRTAPLSPGEERSAMLAIDDRLQQFTIRAVRQQDLRLHEIGVVPSVLLDITAANGGFFARKVPGAIWVSTDDRHVLTLMYMKIPIGRVKVVLASIQDARYARR